MNNKPLILFIEDDEDILFNACIMLEAEGYVVKTAMTLAAARMELQGERIPELLLLDVMLPDGEGLDLLKEIRENDMTADLPVICLTAFGGTSDARQGFVAGANAYLSKPCDERQLVEVMARLLQERKDD